MNVTCYENMSIYHLIKNHSLENMLMHTDEPDEVF